MPTCENCSTPLDSLGDGRPRRWCGDRCRKAAARIRQGTIEGPQDAGEVTRAVVALFDQRADASPEGEVTRRLALALARVADGSTPSVVSAVRLLRTVLAEEAGEDEEMAEFLERIQGPRRAIIAAATGPRDAAPAP